MPEERFTTKDIEDEQAAVLQSVYGQMASPAKEMQADTGLSERTCRNLIRGENIASLKTLFNASPNVPELQQWALEMMGLIQRGDTTWRQRLSQGFGSSAGPKTITIHLDTNTGEIRQ